MIPSCTYCQQPAIRATGADIYPHRPDLATRKFFRCIPCEAHVGTHVKTGHPLGTLANAALRKLRSQAHNTFDPIWQGWVDGELRARKKRGAPPLHVGNTVKKYRTEAYALLAKAMDISVENCHIGAFTEDQCRQVIDLCQSGELYRCREVLKYQ